MREADPRREFLLHLLRAALASVDGRRRVRAALADVRGPGDWWVIAIGKAAGAMTQGAIDALGNRVSRALVISKAGHFPAGLAQLPQVQCMTGGHPVPDAGSLDAGEALLELAAAASPGQRVLALVSGGASSLVESLPEGITLDDLRRLNEWALGAGVDIVAHNAMRRALSALKDGRLLDCFGHCEMRGLLISDVPGDDPAVIGSGLLQRTGAPPDTSGWPDWVRELAARNPEPAHTGSIPVEVVARLDDAILAAERAAVARGVAAMRHTVRLAGDAEHAARRVAHELAAGRGGVHLWGGETTVKLPPQPGRGGRNQHLALAAAQLIAGHDEYLVLAAGTDGNDGNTDDAGALVDAGTVARGGLAGFDAVRALAAADSATFLEASQDLVFTGPTGTNVGDLVIGLRQAAAAV